MPAAQAAWTALRTRWASHSEGVTRVNRAAPAGGDEIRLVQQSQFIHPPLRQAVAFGAVAAEQSFIEMAGMTG